MSEYINLASLKDRGWSGGSINKFKPKVFKAPTELKYCLRDVESIESTEEFIAYKAKSDRKKSLMPRKMSDEQIAKAVQMYEQEIPFSAIGEALGVSKTCIMSSIRHLVKVREPSRNKTSKKLEEQIAKLHKEGKTNVEIGQLLNLDPHTISTSLTRNGVRRPRGKTTASKIPKGEDKYKISDLTEEEKLHIIEVLDMYSKRNEDTPHCIEWQRQINVGGYGVVPFRGRSVLAHRLAYNLYNEDILPEGVPTNKQVMHKCDNRKCINPRDCCTRHGTNQENILDAKSKGRLRNGWQSGGRVSCPK